MTDELAVLLRTATAYPRLAKLDGGSVWKRPLFFAFLVGCAVSLAVADRPTLRLVGPATVYALLIPLVEIAVLRGLLRANPAVSLGRAVDLFFMGHAVWCLWLVMLGGLFACADLPAAFAWTISGKGWIAVIFAAAWSGYTDFCFFRAVTPGRAGRNLLVERVICWSIGVAIFGGGSFWPGLLGVLGK